MLLVPPKVIPTFYGSYSFGRHVNVALTRGINIRILRSSRVALDIDTVEDLIAFLELRAEETFAYNFLVKAEVYKRLKFLSKRFFKVR